jgi:hypothetical protein
MLPKLIKQQNTQNRKNEELSFKQQWLHVERVVSARASLGCLLEVRLCACTSANGAMDDQGLRILHPPLCCSIACQVVLP